MLDFTALYNPAYRGEAVPHSGPHKKTYPNRGEGVHKMIKEDMTINLRLLEDIRDDSENLPAVRLQAIQTLQKLIDVDDPATEENIKTLKELRDSDKTGDGVKIQVIQTLQKLITLVEGEPKDNETPTEESIMAKIRGEKK